MINKTLHHRSLLIFLTCVTTLCVLIFGMRIPDLSQPGHPKPKPRAYIEEQFKKHHETAAKKSLDHVQAELPPVVEPVLHATYRTELPHAFQGAALSSYFPNLSRAPPHSAA
ncbi:hypothetical protein [Geomonas edaphica]|uniref:hypothetical protein n=1 Tax=Geomonas edaphica TaxID=2570226 RepID=UPI0013A5EA22|nr:hypothetical protein [Geomonas edaphica]